MVGMYLKVCAPVLTEFVWFVSDVACGPEKASLCQVCISDSDSGSAIHMYPWAMDKHDDTAMI